MAPDRTPAKAHGNAFGNAFGKVFIATSVDGFIARPDGSLDWLPAGGDGGEDYGYAAFMRTVDGIVMGRSTYESVLGFDGWPFEKPVVVMSRTLGASDVPVHLRGKLRITSAQPAQLVAELRAEGWSSAYIDGGAVIRAFLAAGEVGEMTITRVPVLIGAGRPLFGDIGCDLRLTCLASQAYPSGMVSTRYRVEAGGRVMVRNGAAMSEQAVPAVRAVSTAQAARRGRPSAGRSLSRDQVLDAGLALLEAVGAQGFGLRPLARQLGITPMSVIHHVGDQQELMRSLVERVHGQPLAEPPPGLAPAQRVQALLAGYMERVRRHPALTVCILGDPALFTDSLAAFTQRLRGEVQQCEPSDGDAAVLLDLLIDYTHGHALALALSGEGAQALHGRFEQGLARLLRQGWERQPGP